MRLGNADVDEAERGCASQAEEPELEGGAEDVTCRSFFDLRQRTLVGMDQLSAFRIVALGLLRKLQANTRGTVLYGEVEDGLNRYLRILEADMQKFVSLHDTLHEAAGKQGRLPAPKAASGADTAAAAAANATAIALLNEGMHEIAAVLLACSQMQKRALDLKMGAQHSISDSRTGAHPHVSFSRFVEFLQEALAVSDQLRRKHEELQQLRMRAMASATEARIAAGVTRASSSAGPPA